MDQISLKIEKVIVLGAGPAGLAAALYVARAELKPLVLTGTDLGGQMSLTDRIENYPGFPQGIGGNELANLFQKSAKKFGSQIEYETTQSVDFSKTPFLVKTNDKQYFTKTLIIATGASPKRLNVPGENEFRGRGVSYCATCDGPFFKNKKVAVIGGGDSALEESAFLTCYASSVTVIHRRHELRAGSLLQKRAKENPKIKFIWDTTVQEIRGNNGVESLSIRNLKTNKKSNFSVDGVFIFIGHIPSTEIFKPWLEMDANGYLSIDSRMRTKIPGVFAAGEVADPYFRQVITSAGMGAAAAIEAIRYLHNT